MISLPTIPNKNMHQSNIMTMRLIHHPSFLVNATRIISNFSKKMKEKESTNRIIWLLVVCSKTLVPIILSWLDFIHGNIEKLLLEHSPQFAIATPWFTVVLLGSIELAQSKRLEIFPKENLTQPYEVLLYHLEAIPATYEIDFKEVLRFKGPDGSLFGSPSSTACAFIVTKDSDFLNYLKCMFHNVGNGGSFLKIMNNNDTDPPIHPADEEFIKLWMVDLLENLGLQEYFSEELQKVLEDIYVGWMEDVEEKDEKHLVAKEMYKDSHAFRLLRTHEYRVSPCKFCWPLSNPQIRLHVEENYEEYLSPMLSKLENAMSFSKSLLEKALSDNNTYDRFLFLKDLRDDLFLQIEYELDAPWLAQLDHLVHLWVIQQFEDNEMLWMGKACSFKLAARTHNMLAELAKRNYTLRQTNFKDELGKLKRWAEKSGIRDLGFWRENTIHCFFASTAALATIIDDFLNFHGSMDELQSFTDAIKRKVLFSAVHDHVNTIAKEAYRQQGQDITVSLRQMNLMNVMAVVAMNLWFKVAEWRMNNYVPSIEEYIKVGMISIATDLVIAHAIYLAPPKLSNEILHHAWYKKVSELTMLCARFLNNLQGYEIERKDGKSNLVALIMKANPNATIQDAVGCIENILDRKKKELVEKLLIHLGTLKAYQMFFNGTNAFESPSQLLHDFNRAFYEDLPMKESGLTPLKDEQHSLDIRMHATMAKENRLASRSRVHLHKCNKPSQGSWITPLRCFGYRPGFILQFLNLHGSITI
ncbi:hypothetical protein AMTRI_Chr02g219220 [Amborella trichopoda]